VGWPLGWDARLLLDYGEGARQIVEACAPLPPELSADFTGRLGRYHDAHQQRLARP
jgi:hypothetical protein